MYSIFFSMTKSKQLLRQKQRLNHRQNMSMVWIKTCSCETVAKIYTDLGSWFLTMQITNIQNKIIKKIISPYPFLCLIILHIEPIYYTINDWFFSRALFLKFAGIFHQFTWNCYEKRAVKKKWGTLIKQNCFEWTPITGRLCVLWW